MATIDPQSSKPAARVRFVALGDSFTEGVGDEVSGVPRGWADLLAIAWADALGRPIEYANLAIRGKLVRPIVEEQLEPALALKPTHLSFNGGGNDMLRPKTDAAQVVESFQTVIRRCDEEGVQLILLSGADPSAQLPFGPLIRKRGDQLSAAVQEHVRDRGDIITAYNWPDVELSSPPFWSEDRLHMNARGHHRVAARTLSALGHSAPAAWWNLEEADPAVRLRGPAYYRRHVGPWLKRRFTGTSSGDDRLPKFPDWRLVHPGTLHLGDDESR